MKKIIFFLLCTYTCLGQIKGTITDEKGAPLGRVSVMIENTYNGTSSNDAGQFELVYAKTGKVTLVFQSIGYQSKKVALSIDKFPHTENIVLKEEQLDLKEVVINTKENPANAIIRKAIANRKTNAEKTAKFKADFYSRAIFRLKDVPKKIMGQDIGDFGGALDSTRSGIIYLSETVSKIQYQKPDKLKERIIASKVSGKDNGFSYNTAIGSDFDIYENQIDLDGKAISPIASGAMGYYKYKLEGTFQDENNNMINKIKVISRRDAEPTFDGYIYIVEDSWAVYATDLDIKGSRLRNTFVDNMKLKINFSYNTNTHIWAKTSQNLDVEAGFFGVKFKGKYTYIFSNYEFVDAFEKKTFSNEIVSFENDANKKDATYWEKNRPVQLTQEEVRDYVKKDSIKTLRESKKYLDSIDRKDNKFKIMSPLTGYTYKDSFNKQRFSFDGLLNLGGINFNTVQGWNLTTGFGYTNYKKSELEGKYMQVRADMNYGFSDKRFRAVGSFYHQFNKKTYDYFFVAGGVKAVQFNGLEPISPFVNTISTLFFKDNYMKLYNKEFAQIQYGRDVFNGVNLVGRFLLEERKPLVNTTDYVMFQRENHPYTSNNPLFPFSETDIIEKHHLYKFGLFTTIHFGNKYITRPNAKFNMQNDDYPTLRLNYQNAFAGTRKEYNFQQFTASVDYELPLANVGNLKAKINAGTFINADNISFVDYKHFMGNQTHYVGMDNYDNSFFILPYYSHSTNKSYFESHINYNDNGFLMNKIPGLNLLKSNLILTVNSLRIQNQKPYNEFAIGLENLGFGKYRILRIDYVRSYQNGYVGDGFMFGIKMKFDHLARRMYSSRRTYFDHLGRSNNSISYPL